MVKNSNKYLGKTVFIKTKTGTFDCIGKIKSIGGTANPINPALKDWFNVSVKIYLNANFYKKEQRYYFSEIDKMLTGVKTIETAKLLYTGD